MSGFTPNEIVHPDVAMSFRAQSTGFVSRITDGFISCPPYIIAHCAASCVPPESLELPEGYDQDTLDQIKAITGFVEQDVRVTSRQAEELAQIGVQILELHSQGKVQPPLGRLEKQSVAHLVGIVSRSRR
ncbi:hypothetical protein ABZW18_31590 [Streptomyces sp. NPDC004647]|uniref:hypothetical protein n=1 Tax=Streptomyces sp. NPDC004647 TaxID=3154671 RepID=UPI0033A3C1E9